MSSFKIKAKEIATGDLHEIWCIDDYFGKRKYGYVVNQDGGRTFTEEDFYKHYIPEKRNDK